MYKILTIGKKEYKLEYTVEASLYDECVEKAMDFSTGIFGTGSLTDEVSKLPQEKKIEAFKNILKNLSSSISSLPSTTFSIFYAGLLEHHGPNGDKTVTSKEDVKGIIREYFSEHAGDGTDNYFSLMMICMEQMNEDNFFERTGITKFMESIIPDTKEAPKPNRAQRRAKKASEK